VASPQKENGYTAIANELLEAIMRIPIPDHARRVLLCVIRYSYGWNRKDAKLKPTQIARAVGIDVRLVPRSVKRLVDMQIVTKQGNIYRVQKDYSLWKIFIPRDEKTSSVEMNSFIRRDDESSSVGMKQTHLKFNNGKGSRGPKDIYKDILNTSLSQKAVNSAPDLTAERERLEKRVRKLFPACTGIPKGISTEKIWLFLHKIGTGEIQPATIRSPVSYMKGMLEENVGALIAADIEAKNRETEDRERKRRGIEEQERLKEDNRDSVKQQIGDFLGELEGKSAVGV
jgi:phage replication O-like protein O